MSKRADKSKEEKTPGTILAERIRARANKLTDAEREELTAEAMRIIYGSESKAAAHAHSR